MEDLTPEEVMALRRSLIGDAKPLASFGVAVVDVPWWRRRIQRYIMPSRYRLWVQLRIMEQLEEHYE